jgi:glutamate formiminotransferase/formiminotetrahydrofolate cyclodeaminase
MKIADSAWDSLLQAAGYGNIASKSDVEVGARALEVGIWGALRNVLINMADIRDEEYVDRIIKEAESIHKRAERTCKEILEVLDKRSRQ